MMSNDVGVSLRPNIYVIRLTARRRVGLVSQSNILFRNQGRNKIIERSLRNALICREI